MRKVCNCFLFYILSKPLTLCQFITPGTVSDIVNLYPEGTSADLDLGKNDKPWLAYIYSNLIKSLTECYRQAKTEVHMSTTWKRVLHFQLSYRITQQIMENLCPDSNNLFTEHSCPVLPGFPTTGPWTKHVYQTNQTVAIGTFTTTFRRCSHIKLILQSVSDQACVFYKFTVAAALRINITFFKIDLLTDERVGVKVKHGCWFQVGNMIFLPIPINVFLFVW